MMCSARHRFIRRRTGRGLASALCSLVFALQLGCGDRGGESGRGLDSGIWPAAAPPWPALRTPDAEQALRAAGIGSQLVEAAVVEPEGRLELAPARAPLPGLAAVLVVRGSWQTIEALSRSELGELAEQLVLMAVGWESTRITVRGFHLVPAGPVGDRGRAAASISRLARELPDRLPLSLHLDADLLAGPESPQDLARTVATLVCEVYGQPWSEPDRPDRWDLEGALERARRADAAGRPFLAAIAIEGRIFDPEGGAVTARGLDARTLASSSLAIEGAFSYEGFHRQLLDLTPTRAVGAFGAGDAVAQLEPGRKVRLARPTARHLVTLLERLRGQQLEHLEGVLWTGGGGASVAAVPVTRLPDVVSGTVDSGFELRLTRDAATRRLRVELRNGEDPTAWADRDYNVVEIGLEGAVFGPVELGSFTRMELDERSSSTARSPMERLRRADRLRLYFVSLEPGALVASGDIRVRPAAEGWQATARASVLGAAGEVEVVGESVAKELAEGGG